MIKYNAGGSLEVFASDKLTLEKDLDAAVELLRRQAIQERLSGILVTQRGFAEYTVAISERVPFGQTHEQRE